METTPVTMEPPAAIDTATPTTQVPDDEVYKKLDTEGSIPEVLAQHITNKDCFFGTGSAMRVLVTNGETTETKHHKVVESNPSVLTHLLQADPSPVANFSDASVTKDMASKDSSSALSSPTLTHILQSDNVTSSTETGATGRNDHPMSPDSSTQNQNLTLAQILMKPRPSNRTPAPSTAIALDSSMVTLHQVLANSSPLLIHKTSSSGAIPKAVDDPSDVIQLAGDGLLGMCMDENGNSPGIDCFPLFSLEEDVSLEHGIAAYDVGSLLTQFEEAAVHLPDEFPLQFDEDTATPSIPDSALQTSTTVTTQSAPKTKPQSLSKINSQSAPNLTQQVVATPQPINPKGKRSGLGNTSGVKSTCSSGGQSLSDPCSEVVKLLQSKRRPIPPASHSSPKPVPAPERLDKFRSHPSRKSAIMLDAPLPTRRSKRIHETTNKSKDKYHPYKPSRHASRSTPPPVPLALQPSSSNPNSPMRISLPDINLDNYTPASSPCSDNSQPPATGKPSKRISISQYKDRIRSCHSSRSSSPVCGMSSEQTVSQAAEILNVQLQEEQDPDCEVTEMVSSDYFDLISDHDYCQNVPIKFSQETTQEIRPEVVGLDLDFACFDGGPEAVASEVVVTEIEVKNEPECEKVGGESTSSDDTGVVEEVESLQKLGASLEDPMVCSENSINSLDEPAATTQVKDSLEYPVLNQTEPEVLLKQPGNTLDMPVVCKEEPVRSLDGSIVYLEEPCEEKQPTCLEQRRSCLDKLAYECDSVEFPHTVLKSLLLNSNLEEECKVQAAKDRVLSQEKMKTKTQSTDEDSQNVDEKPRRGKDRTHYRKRSPELVFDKLPTYYTALAAPKPPGLPRTSSTTQILQRQSKALPQRDRDPSPGRDDNSAFNKVPAYYTCFTNSTKYDENACEHSEADWDAVPKESAVISNGGYASSTSSGSHRTRDTTRQSRGRQRSYSSSRCSTCSSSSSSDSSPEPPRRRKRKPTHSRYRSRSPVRSIRSHYSRSRSRDRSKYRSLRHRRRRSSSSSAGSYDGHDKTDREKQIQIEERRIVYVGRIPSNFTRRDIRKKFETFGNITDVSVHFREHGDNYGFVTFSRTRDAFNCVEKGCRVPGCENFDMCFGGRREFCKTEYADLDGNMEIEEEMAPVLGWSDSKSGGDLDFDTLLKSTMRCQKNRTS